MGTSLGTGKAGALTTLALDHAQPRTCAVVVEAQWAGWLTTVAALGPCGQPQGQKPCPRPRGRWHVGWVALGWRTTAVRAHAVAGLLALSARFIFLW